MNQTIRVTVRDVYGRATVYPACATSRLLAQLAGTKTFTAGHVATLRALGYTIDHAADCHIARRSALAL